MTLTYVIRDLSMDLSRDIIVRGRSLHGRALAVAGRDVRQPRVQAPSGSRLLDVALRPLRPRLQRTTAASGRAGCR